MIEQHAGVVVVGKDRLATGLFWQTAPSAPAAGKEARLLAAKEEMAADLFCVRRDGQPQFALGYRGAGHEPGMTAIAAVLANAVKEQSWVGTFAVREGWLHVMVRKGAVMPDGDALFIDEDTARIRFQEALSIGGWEAILAPSNWDIASARATQFTDLVGRTRDARMQPVTSNPWRPVILGGVVVAALTLAWFAFVPEEPEPMPIVPDVPVAAPPPPPPWEGTPRAADLILACEETVLRVGVIPGYSLELVSCNGNGATARHKRTIGTVAWLAPGTSTPNPDSATQHLPLSRPLAARGEEAPWRHDDIRRRLWAAAQTYRLDLTMNTDKKTSKGPPNAQAPDHVGIALTVGSKLPPSVIASLLAPVPTLVVTDVIWSPTGWQIKGTAYVR